MANTPAAHLARLKVQYPAYQIIRHSDLIIAKARDGNAVIRAGTPTELEVLLLQESRNSSGG